MRAPLDKANPVPLYYQLAEWIRGRIDSGELVPGEQLPATQELSEQAGISRMTTRQAISYLAHQGRLVVKPGLGTFVAEPKLVHETVHLLGFTEEMFRHGHSAASKVLAQSLVTPSLLIGARLNLKPNDLVVEIVRLRLSEETPMLLETVFVPSEVAPLLEQEDLTNASLYDIFRLRGIQLDYAQQTVEATTATEAEARLMEIDHKAPLLLIEGVTYTTASVPVEAFRALYRADKFKIGLNSQRPVWPGESRSAQLSVVMRDSD